MSLHNSRYKLVASEWSECRVLQGNTPSPPPGRNNDAAQQRMSSASASRGSCGGGLRTRNVSCVLTYTNQPVDVSFCIELQQIHKTER